MKVEVKETGEWKRELFVELTDEEVRAEMKRVVREFRKKTQLPGFRKGKVPETIIEQRFSQHLEKEMLNTVIPKAYKEAVAESELDPIAPGTIRDFDYKKGEPLSFYADLEIRPSLVLKDLDDIELQKRIFDVPEEEIQSTIDALLDQGATWETVERPSESGDRVKLELRDQTDGATDDAPEETEVVVGADGMLPEFVEALTGAGAGDEKTVPVSYPDEMEQEELKGSSRTFAVKVLEVSEKKLPAFDDAFASELGYESTEALRAKIQARLEAEEVERADRELEGMLIEAIVQRHPFDAPDAMVENLLTNIARDYRVPDEQMEEFRESQHAAAVRYVKRALVLDAVIEAEELTASDEECEAELTKEVEDDRQAAKRIAQARKSGELERIRHRLRERKALDFLLGKAEVEEVRGPRPALPPEEGGAAAG